METARNAPLVLATFLRTALKDIDESTGLGGAGLIVVSSRRYHNALESIDAVATELEARANGDASDGVAIAEIQAINTARSTRWMAGSPGWTTLEIAGELAGEVGELANVCKKLRRSELGVPGNKVSDAELRTQARSEIADVFIVLMLTASKLGVDLEDAVRETFNAKSEQMGFPERIPGRALRGAPAPDPAGVAR